MDLFDKNKNKQAAEVIFNKLEEAAIHFESIINTSGFTSILQKMKEQFRKQLIEEYVKFGEERVEFLFYVFTFYLTRLRKLPLLGY